MVVGWYHSHPGFGCWLSGVDINTQQVSCPTTAGMHRKCQSVTLERRSKECPKMFAFLHEQAAAHSCFH